MLVQQSRPVPPSFWFHCLSMQSIGACTVSSVVPQSIEAGAAECNCFCASFQICQRCNAVANDFVTESHILRERSAGVLP